MRKLPNTVKQVTRSAIRRAGYDIVRVSDGPTPADQREREIVNAYYMGHCFRCFAGDAQCEYILRGKGWDNQLPDILAELDSAPGAHVIEVGANVGGSLVPHAAAHVQLTFHCVEPVPEFYALLEQNVASFAPPNVRLYNCAATARPGDEVTIYTQLGTAGALPNYDGHVPIGSLRVAGATLDDLFGQLPVALIKVDTDGFEFEVLKGADQVLRDSRPILFLEFHTKLMRANGIDPREVLGFLAAHGYTRVRAWDNFGSWQLDTDNFDTLLQAADETPNYLDLLFRTSEP